MARTKLSSVVLAAVALAFAGGLLAAQTAQPGLTYPLWEYRTEIVRGPGSSDPRTDTGRGAGRAEMSDSALNSLGREGWEVATATRREVRVGDQMQTETMYVFKRSRRDAPR